MTIDAALSRVRQPRRAPLFGNCWANPMSAAAANAKLVPNEELERLNAKMHVSRGGQLTPYGDPHGVLAETKAGLDQVVRERAYLLWEQAGRPDGRADDFWHQAQYQRFCERAYALWEREGCPEGKADDHWYRTRAFEES